MNTTISSEEIKQCSQTEFSVKLLSITIFIISIFLSNLLVILVLCRSSFTSCVRLSMFSLFITDVIAGLDLLLSFFNALYDRWLYGDGMCSLTTQLRPFFIFLTSYTYLLMNIDKYVAIRHPLKHHIYMSERNVKIFLGSVWTISVSVWLTLFLLIDSSYVYAREFYVCSFNFGTDDQLLRISSSWFIGCLVPIYVIQTYCNIRLYKISSRAKQQRSGNRFNNTN